MPERKSSSVPDGREFAENDERNASLSFARRVAISGFLDDRRIIDFAMQGFVMIQDVCHDAALGQSLALAASK
jgi:hypothetical protein